MLARRLMGGSGEVLVAASAASALGQNDAFVRLLKVVDHLAGSVVIGDRAHRNFQDNVFAVATGAIRALAVPSAFGFMLGIETKMDQRVVALAGFEHNIAAASAISPGGSAARHKLFAAKGHAAIPAIASLHFDSCFIDKHACE